MELKDSKQEFVFTDIPEKPYLSALRGFSAPVKLNVEGESEEDLLFLLAHDTDSFNKWEASQRLQKSLLRKLYEAALQASQVNLAYSPLRIYQGLPWASAFQLSLCWRQPG